jgi:hypothetical protein
MTGTILPADPTAHLGEQGWSEPEDDTRHRNGPSNCLNKLNKRHHIPNLEIVVIPIL